MKGSVGLYIAVLWEWKKHQESLLKGVFFYLNQYNRLDKSVHSSFIEDINKC